MAVVSRVNGNALKNTIHFSTTKSTSSIDEEENTLELTELFSEDCRHAGVKNNNRVPFRQREGSQNSPEISRRPNPDRVVSILQKIFLTQIQPTIRTMQLFGLFPNVIRSERRLSQAFKTGLTKKGYFIAITILYIFINLFAFGMTIHGIRSYMTDVKYGLWHPETIIAVILCFKPVQSFSNLLIFSLQTTRHHAIIRQLHRTYHSFASQLDIEVDSASLNHPIRLTAVLSVSLTFILMLVDKAVTHAMTPQHNITIDYAEVQLTEMLNYPSFIILPMITAWQLIPLAYFICLNRMCRQWARQMRYQLLNYDRYGGPISKYYRQFLELATLQSRIGEFFNTFVMISLGITVASFCLILYFVTQANEGIIPQDTNLALVFYVNIIWAAWQLVILVIYMASVMIFGYRTNESARSVLTAAIMIDTEDPDDQHNLFCLAQKVQSQFSWGITIWKGFLIERSVLFSVAGVVITYAIILLNMKPSEDPPCPTFDDIVQAIGNI